MKNVLILGIGNILQSDDGIGVHIINQMQMSDIPLPENIELMDGGTAGHDLIALMEGRDKIVIVDALKAQGNPGEIYRFKPEQAKTTRMNYSLHEIGIMEVIRDLNILGENPEIEFVGIIPEDITTMDITISNAVRESIPRAIEVILEAAMN